jgi:hypothetical protein
LIFLHYITIFRTGSGCIGWITQPGARTLVLLVEMDETATPGSSRQLASSAAFWPCQ